MVPTGSEISFLYMLDSDSINSFFKKLWNDNILTMMLTAYPDRASLVIDLQAYPFDITRSTNFSILSTSNIYIGTEDIDVNVPVVYGNVFHRFWLTKSDFSNALSESYLDYTSLTEYKLYLPFIGTVDVNGDMIRVYKNLCIDYDIDITSGDCCVKIYCYDTEHDNAVMIMDTISANVSLKLPVAGGDLGLFRTRLLNSISAAATAYAGMTPTVSTTKTLGSETTIKRTNPDTGRLKTFAKIEKSPTTSTTERHSPWGAVSTFNAINNLLMTQSHSSISGSQDGSCIFSNYLGNPILIIKRPYEDNYDNYGHYAGYPLMKTRKLNDVKGFTKVSSIHPNICCTHLELSEIESLLYGGVIITSNPVPEVPEEPSDGTTDTPSEDTSSGGTFTPVEPIAPIEPETKWLSPWSGSFRVTSTYGEKRTYTATDGKVYTDVHQGLDMVGIGDINIYSIAEGTVEHIGWQNASNPSVGFGYYCRVNTNGKLFYYAHMRADSSTLKVGDKISKGTKIGVMGSTGQVTGAHLHLEVRGSTASSSHENICSYTLLPNEIGTYE